MLKNKIVVRKIRNIVILFMALIIMIGTYKNIKDSRAENVIELTAIALDNYGYLENEEFTLEAKQIENDLYEIKLPECVNTKKINQVIRATLKDSTNSTIENVPVEVIYETVKEGLADSACQIEEYKIKLTKEQIKKYKLNIELKYNVAILTEKGNGKFERILLADKSEDEINQIKITDEAQVLYNKVLKYEDKQNGKIVELKGLLPIDAELQVKKVPTDSLTEIFEDAKIDIAYDIKILTQVVSEVPVDETNPNGEKQKIIETVEINPEDFGVMCEVIIKNIDVLKETNVFHVKEDNSVEKVDLTENDEDSITFITNSFSIYALSSDSRAASTYSYNANNRAPAPKLSGFTSGQWYNKSITMTVSETATDRRINNWLLLVVYSRW